MFPHLSGFIMPPVPCRSWRSSKSRPRCTSLALIYLQRAKEAGLLLDRIAEDPDLAPLKNNPEFARLLASTRKTGK